ncbi:uncharacterized protein VTP21DRAFT_6456 [Calcarisporiella thermophila]|uniref:uncharacterized protein n=1 Tax=Calcarisporiella thermophila TaxID=911321 RepID=UPI0037426D61
MANRKLQSEVERVLKKVAEGVETFEEIFDKLHAAPSQNQKEKLEQDLKKEIKKLQRLRDQIRTWISSNEIKDKTALIENRKMIEQQMERFKACEKEMKTKAYSKEGLSQSMKLDPKEKEKADCMAWITQCVDELGMQIESLEAEIETLQTVLKKSRKESAKQERLSDIEHRVEQHKWHTGRLELIMRLLENGKIPVEKVTNIQEDVRYYVDNNQDEDFMEDEGIYDDLDLEEEEELFAMPSEDYLGSLAKDDASVEENKGQKEKPLRESSISEQGSKDEEQSPTLSSKSVKQPPAPQRKPSTNQSSTSPVLPRAGLSSQSPRPVASGTISQPLPQQRYASVAASQQPSAQRNIISPTTNNATLDSTQTAAQSQAPEQSPTVQPETEEATRSAMISTNEEIQNPTDDQPVKPSTLQNSQSTNTPPLQEPPQSTVLPQPQPQQNQQPMQDRALENETGGMLSENPIEPTSTPISVASNISESQLQAARPANVDEASMISAGKMMEDPDKLPATLADLVPTYDAAKEKLHNRNDIGYTHLMLETSLQFAPDYMDIERPKHYIPRHPYSTPASYPQQPLPIFDNPNLLEKLDIDTIFFIFYYQQGTFQQYLAARELKRQSWRFHKKYLTWFQRHEEPRVITDEYEEGTYIYFDYEAAWCQRKKTEFRFEYRYLEDAELL